MEINYPLGIIATLLMVICLYGTTYAVIALNVGWRFGYWLTSACFGAMMVLLSIFWIVNPVGPQGAFGAWLPIAAGEEIATVDFEDQTFSTPAQYPAGGWQPEEGEGGEQADELSSAISTCLSTAPERLPEVEREACAAAQELMPADEDIPILEGAAVAVIPRMEDIRFATEDALLAQATVIPITTDPRLSEDPDGVPLAEPFRVVAVRDEGSLRLPAYNSLLIFLVYTAFHLWGLHRAEQRKLSPAVT